MRIDYEIFHKLSEEDEFNIHSQSGFSLYCDVFVKYLSVSEQNTEYRVRSPAPLSGKLDINEMKLNEFAELVSREIFMSYNFYNIRRFCT